MATGENTGKLVAPNTEESNSVAGVQLQTEDLSDQPPLGVGGELVRNFDPPTSVTITTGVTFGSWPFDWGVEPVDANVYKDLTTGKWIIETTETSSVRIWWHGGDPDNPADPSVSGGNLIPIETIEYFGLV